MTITIEEFKKNVDKYMQKALDEDIYITENGRIIVKLSDPNKEKLDILNSLVGIVPEEDRMSLDEIKVSRMERQ